GTVAERPADVGEGAGAGRSPAADTVTDAAGADVEGGGEEGPGEAGRLADGDPGPAYVRVHQGRERPGPGGPRDGVTDAAELRAAQTGPQLPHRRAHQGPECGGAAGCLSVDRDTWAAVSASAARPAGRCAETKDDSGRQGGGGLPADDQAAAGAVEAGGEGTTA